MNCQPNDLAFVVRDTTESGCVANLIGTPVRVEQHFKAAESGRDAWLLRRNLKCPCCGESLFALYDADLQPVRGLPASAASTRDARAPEEAVA